MHIDDTPSIKTPTQRQVERNADHTSPHDAIWQDIVGGMEYMAHMADALAREMTRKGRNMTDQAAARLLDDRLHAGATQTAVESVWMGADELPFPLPMPDDADEHQADLRFSYTETATGPALWVQVVTPRYAQVIDRHGNERTVRVKTKTGRDASNWTTVGIVRDHKIGDESVERALAILRGYVNDRRAGDVDEQGLEEDLADALDNIL